jgi:hypothetical protein
MSRWSMDALPVRLVAVAAFVVTYFVVLRWVRVLVAGVLVFPAASGVDAGRENGFAVYYTPGSTGVYVYSEAYLARESGRMQMAADEHMQQAGGAADSVVVADASAAPSAEQTEPEGISAVGAPVSMASGFGEKPFYLFKGFGDQFFLVGGAMLLLLGFVRHVGYLFAYHVGISVVGLALLFVGLLGYPSALRLMDFISAYLTPAVSMLWVVMVYAQRKTNPISE